jgi:hypothetical protein
MPVLAHPTPFRGWMAKDFKKIFNVMADTASHINPGAGHPCELAGGYYKRLAATRYRIRIVLDFAR